jgi:hypothetical protein
MDFATGSFAMVMITANVRTHSPDGGLPLGWLGKRKARVTEFRASRRTSGAQPVAQVRVAPGKLAEQQSGDRIEPERRIAHQPRMEVGPRAVLPPLQRVEQALRTDLELLSVCAERCRILAARSGSLGRVVEQDDVVDARHMLRHACGYALANAGHDTRRIQDWLGHRSIQHTTRYTELSAAPFKYFWR